MTILETPTQDVALQIPPRIMAGPAVSPLAEARPGFKVNPFCLLSDMTMCQG